MVYCCVPFCKSSSRKRKADGISFHEFPIENEVREAWLKRVSRKDFKINPNSPSSVVCSLHFVSDDYCSGLKIKRLKKGALPSVFPSYPKYMIPHITQRKEPVLNRKRNTSSSEHFTAKRSRTEILLQVDTSSSNFVIGDETNNQGRPVEIDYNLPGNQLKYPSQSGVDINNPTVISSIDPADAELLLHFTNAVGDTFNNDNSTSGMDQLVTECKRVKTVNKKCQTSRDFINELKNKNTIIKRLRSRLYKVRIQNKKLQKKYSDSQSKVKGYEGNVYHANVEKLLALQEHDDERANFLLKQIENYFVGRPTWNETVLRQCSLWYSCSPKGYNMARNMKILRLPCKSTLSRYLGPFTGEFGFTSLVKLRLEEECNKLQPEERFGSLIIDEMSVKPQYTYDKNLDSFFGKSNNVEDKEINEVTLANRLLCFVLTGLSTTYLIPCSYYFTRQLTSVELHTLTSTVLEEVEKIGFFVVRIVTDNYKTNVGMFKIFGEGILKERIEHPCDSNRTLFFSFDQNHIVKNLRSLLFDREMMGENGLISGKYIKKLYYLQKNETIKPVRFLTRKHIEPSNFEKMNVRRAVAIFSPPVTAALECLKNHSTIHPKASEFKDAGPSIEYMKTIYKWFSLHDVCSRRSHIVSRNPDRMHFFSCSDERLDWLENTFLPYLENIKSTSELHRQPFLSKETYEAVVLTTNSTIGCIKYLLENEFQYVLTRAFNSDPVELTFSALRQMSGGNDVLDVRATMFNMEKILKTGYLISSKSSNVGRQVVISTPVRQQPKLSLHHKNQREVNMVDLQEETSEKLLLLHKSPVVERPTLKLASVGYVAGFVVRAVQERTDCLPCIMQIATNKTNSPLQSLISNQDRGGLRYPKPVFVSLLATVESIVVKSMPYVPQTGCTKFLKELILPHMSKSPLFCCEVEGHNQFLSKLSLSKFLNGLMKNHAYLITDKLKSNVWNKPQSRKILKVTPV